MSIQAPTQLQVVETPLAFHSGSCEKDTAPGSKKFTFDNIQLILSSPSRKGEVAQTTKPINPLEIHSRESFKAHVAMQAYASHLSSKHQDAEFNDNAKLLENAAFYFSEPDKKGDIEVSIRPYNVTRASYEKVIKIKVKANQLDYIEKLANVKIKKADSGTVAELTVTNWSPYREAGAKFAAIQAVAAKPSLEDSDKEAIVSYKEVFGDQWWKNAAQLEADPDPTNLIQRLCEKARKCLSGVEGLPGGNDQDAFKKLIDAAIKKRDDEAAAAAASTAAVPIDAAP